jgi:hypothetical protein
VVDGHLAHRADPRRRDEWPGEQPEAELIGPRVVGVIDETGCERDRTARVGLQHDGPDAVVIPAREIHLDGPEAVEHRDVEFGARKVVNGERVAAHREPVDDRLKLGVYRRVVREPEEHAVRAHRRNPQAAQQLSGDRQVGDTRSDELLESDDAQEVPEQADLRAVVGRDEVLGVDRV